MSTMLLVNADDFGLGENHVAGILRAHDHGVVTSTSILAACLRVEWVEELSLRPNLARVAHLTLTEGKPLLGARYPQRFLTSDGSFPSRFRYGRRCCYELDKSVIQEEFRLQIEAVLKYFDVSGLDTHHHIHEVPSVFEIVLDLAQKYGVALRAMNATQRDVCSKSGVMHPSVVMDTFNSDGYSVERLWIDLLRIENSDGFIEVVCHPATNSKDPMTRYTEGRGRELAVLTDANFATRLRDRFVLISDRNRVRACSSVERFNSGITKCSCR